MYAETGLMLPYSHNFPQLQQFDEVYFQENLHSPSIYCQEIPGSLAQTSSAMPDYYLGEGDLFKAPEPILEEPFMDLDPMTSSISMLSFGGDVLSPQTSLAIPEIESSFESGQLLSDVFYECKKDLLAKVGNETPLSEVVSIESSVIKSDEISVADQKFLGEDEAPPIQKSVSFSCLRSMDVGPEALLRPKFIDFSVLDFGAVNVMRRAYSDGDIKNLGNGNNISSTQQTPTTMLPQIPSFTWEDRKEKLSRYRQKKSKRNFGRKIKYACRKALADSQPRIRGRFAKTEDVVEVSMKKQ